jgi:hypothetical protein
VPLGGKIVFTAAIGLFLVIFVFAVNRGDRASVDARFWRGGERDGIRQLMMKPDGTFRRYTKAVVVTWLIAFVSAMWILL